MIDRLSEILNEREFLYGMLCRDATMIDVELMAQAGYHIIWIDLEHSHQSTSEALRLCRFITHLGMVPLVRILEATRTHVQRLLDGGAQIINLPDVRSAQQAANLVELGKYPPLGERGVSSTSASTGFSLGSDTGETLKNANAASHLMVMFESDAGYTALDSILAVDGIDMVTVGPMDWSVGLGIYGEDAKAHLTAKIDNILKATEQAGKIATMTVPNVEQARAYVELGVRIFFLGVDVAMKRNNITDTVGSFQRGLG